MPDNQTTTLELVAQELQNRIGQITSNYETQIAVLKAQATQQINELEKQIQDLKDAAAAPIKSSSK